MIENNHNWGAEGMLFLLLFYAMSNTKPPFDIQPCCTDHLDNIIKFMMEIEKQTPKEERDRNIAYFEPDPEDRDYFSGVGGPTYD